MNMQNIMNNPINAKREENRQKLHKNEKKNFDFSGSRGERRELDLCLLCIFSCLFELCLKVQII